MRIFIDCTHTANHTYKKTGIHRVVRQLTTELVNLSLNNPSLEVIPVRFDRGFIHRVTSLEQQESHEDLEVNQAIRLIPKILNKFRSFSSRAKNKIKRSWFFKKLDNYISEKEIKYIDKFEEIKFSSEDIYLIVDSNWDLPGTYYKFLKGLKSYKVTIVLICYDLIPIKFPEFCSKDFSKVFTDFFLEYSPLFDKVICISRNSANDYIEFHKKNLISNVNQHQSVESFRLGCDYSNPQQSSDGNQPFEEHRRRAFLKERYILVVGSLSPHKNIKTIITAFDELIESQKNIHLVFAGNRGWHWETDQIIESNKMYGELIHVLDAVTDSQLQILYKNCYCLVQASFYEGFGLPVVEALHHCKPVIASNAGSLPEVGGDFCVYFDPNQPRELYEALKELVSSELYYNQWVTRLETEYKPFSWQESAEQLLSRLLEK